MVRFRFNYFDHKGLSSFLFWDDIEPEERRIIEELSPVRRVIRGRLTFCIALSPGVRIRKPSTIKGAVNLARKHAAERVE